MLPEGARDAAPAPPIPPRPTKVVPSDAPGVKAEFPREKEGEGSTGPPPLRFKKSTGWDMQTVENNAENTRLSQMMDTLGR
jgi:hypothetical protein